MNGKFSSSGSMSVTSTSSVDKVLHSGLLDVACNKLLEFHCHKAGKTIRLESSARTYMVDYTIDIFRGLCDPCFPQSVRDVVDRMSTSFPQKLEPPEAFIEEIRALCEKGKKKTSYLPADKVASNFKVVYPRAEHSVCLFLVHLIEFVLGQIIQWTVNYESKLESGFIEENDVQLILSLFGTPKLSKSSVCESLPFLQRQSSDYYGLAKELRFFLRSSVEHLGIVVRVFGDPIMDELAQLALAAQSTYAETSSGCEIAVAAHNLLQAVYAAQELFGRASELLSHMSLLSECVEDAFEDQSRLLGACLIEPAEDETFHTFAYYSETLFSNDCYLWACLLSETPCMIRVLNNSAQTILRTVIEKASSRRLADLEVRYSDPHTCSLCTSGIGSDVGGALGSNSSSHSASSHLGDSPQALNSLSGFYIRPSRTSAVRIPSSADSLGAASIPTGSTVTYQRVPRSTASPSLGVFIGSTARNSTVSNPIPTTMPSRKYKRIKLGRRSVSGSPSPPPASKCIPINTDLVSHRASTYLADLKTGEVCISTSSSSSSVLNDSSSKSGQDSGAHSYDQRRIGGGSGTFLEFLGESPDEISMKDLQTRLMELFPTSVGNATNVNNSCSHMVIAFRYLLPQLLQLPVLQLVYLYEIIEALRARAIEDNEKELLKDVLSVLSKTRLSIQNSMSSRDWIKSTAPRLANFLKTPLGGSVLSFEAQTNLEDLVLTVRRSLQSSERSISVSEFLLDGLVQTRSEGNRSKRSKRVAYLFSRWLLLCKKQRRVLGTVVGSSSGGSTHAGLKVKTRIPLEQFHVIDSGKEVTDNNETLFTLDIEYWEIPQRGSFNPEYQSTTPPVSSASTNDSQSISSSNRTIHSASTASNSTASQMGSVLSISTLTSTNTLVGSSVSAVSPPFSATTELEVSSCTSPMPTAGAAVAAASAAMLGALSSAPTRRVTLLFTSQAEKSDWIAALIYLQLGRLFKRYLRDLPRQEVPLVLPPPDVYRFATPDSIINIIFETDVPDSSVEIPVIRAATMYKLIERMTYHTYCDTKTVNVFLMTYRRYIEPTELLELLIERFNVPEPDFIDAAEQAYNLGDVDNPVTIAIRLEKRFRSMYKRRVQYRVTNFLIKWLKNASFYKLDILPNEALRRRLSEFLDSVDARNLADHVASIQKSLRGVRPGLTQTLLQMPSEPLDLGLATSSDQVTLSNVHPLELARQITLYEWELYSRIEFWEVNGQEKINAPNLQASLDFSNKLKWWLVYSIVTATHLEDRVIMIQRVADLAMLFEQLNNLQGAHEAKAALLSSPVYRLNNTFDYLLAKSKNHHRQFFDSLRRSIQADDDVADYERRLHELNPPGLPFIAVSGKTQLIHLELKYPDYVTVPNTQLSASPPMDCTGDAQQQQQEAVSLINFWKCRKLAKLVEYYLSFQQTPYTFAINEPIRQFLHTFDPLGMVGVTDEDSYDDIMYEKSLELQPKQPAEPVVVTERTLSVVEQRIAALLNASPPDYRVTTDSKEFRALIQCTFASRMSAANVENSNRLVPSGDNLSRRGETGSLGRGSCRPESSCQQLSHAFGRTAPTGEAAGCQHHRGVHHCHPGRCTRSASSSPAPASYSSYIVHSPAPLPPGPTSPPPLPPRATQYRKTERNPEQFVNQTIFQQPGYVNRSSDTPTSPGKSDLNLPDTEQAPPVIPPRPNQRASSDFQNPEVQTYDNNAGHPRQPSIPTPPPYSSDCPGNNEEPNSSNQSSVPPSLPPRLHPRLQSPVIPPSTRCDPTSTHSLRQVPPPLPPKTRDARFHDPQ